MKYFTSIINIVFGIVLVILHFTEGLNGYLIKLGFSPDRFVVVLWLGIFFIVFGIIIFVLKIINQKIADLAQHKQQ